jgi:two-component system LytT family response regulator
VFVTAYDQYALGAFEVHALDYLLKPFNRKRFAQALARVRDHLARVAERRVDERLLGLLRELRAPRRHLARFVVRTEGRLRLIDADRVEWIEAADNYAVLHVGSASYTVRETMSRLAEELDPGKFVRIQRSAIVRIDRIAELLPAFHGDFVVVLQDGTRLSLTRVYRPQLEAALGRPL